jgi:hypothetical protein
LNYSARISLERTQMQVDNRTVDLSPGMAVTLEIKTLHAEGAQIYECKVAKNGGLAWQFREPIAILLLTAVRLAGIMPGQVGSMLMGAL